MSGSESMPIILTDSEFTSLLSSKFSALIVVSLEPILEMQNGMHNTAEAELIRLTPGL